MKNSIALITISFFLFSFTFYQQFMLDYKIGSEFSMTIKGTSNVHDWESSVEKVTGTAVASFGEDGTLKIDECIVNIPVTSIKSTKGSMMDKKTWKALKSDEFANINYRLVSFDNVMKTGTGFTANAKGKLTIAGATQSITMKVKGKELNNGSLEITGSKALKMTDFNIEPPTALFGTMTTGNDITIDFRIVLNRD